MQVTVAMSAWRPDHQPTRVLAATFLSLLVQVLLQAEATKWLALTPVETTEGSCHSRLVLLRAAQEELHPSSLDRRRFQREAP